ncbi:metal ABC transporter ATP-binding protein [Actinoplanes bogorensis]|uniref:Metal ABC transporter ATP-binding protein n=1 Tax=Paractinoplanes bogorensis TaxID=1610840 RepID=A0ABS5YL25_9ACTN|nr:metal ABC transporter ATP-binding protein [Actinoplanes bogorensis]MBU2663408.1 metal ABC transporter ATP-binding protein [Actinoplanes bogorensis]
MLRYHQAAVGYRGVPVLTDVTFEVGPGQILVLAGPNGAGKSTLIKSMLGQAEVLSGKATIDGPTGYVPQLGDLDPDFPISAGQVVLMGRYRPRGWWRPTSKADRRAAATALARVDLQERSRVRFGLLSGGQRQRVLLARALASEPRLLLLDEPFNGVDVVSQQAIVGVLRELVADGVTLVLSTHDLGLARDLADVVCLVNGRQWAFGPPSEVLSAETLRLAYGGHAIDLPDGRTVLVDP